ncbi:MAG: ABC transporter permease [Microthrixaceae bacterium]|nr:ABC transporter permease [Microthrixaceae bacterium]
MNGRIDADTESGAGSAAIAGASLDSSLLDVGPSRSLFQDAWRRFKRNKLAMFGLFLVGFLVIVAIVGPFLVDDPTKLSKTVFREPPTNQHPFGVDHRGADVLARVVHGIRLSMFIGFIATVLQTVIGIFIGAVAGWYGRWVDTISMRFVDIMLGIPYIILAYAFITVLGRGVPAVILTLALTAWLQTARTVRAGFIQVKELEYVEAARALGVGSVRIMVRHILPNVFQPVVVLMAVGVGAAILSEAALSFLGVGIQPPEPSLGLMINDARSFLGSDPYLLFFPGLAIVLTVLGFLLVGDGLRDALDVKDN